MDSITGLGTLYSGLSTMYALLFFMIVIALTVMVAVGLHLSKSTNKLTSLIDDFFKQRKGL